MVVRSRLLEQAVFVPILERLKPGFWQREIERGVNFPRQVQRSEGKGPKKMTKGAKGKGKRHAAEGGDGYPEIEEHDDEPEVEDWPEAEEAGEQGALCVASGGKKVNKKKGSPKAGSADPARQLEIVKNQIGFDEGNVLHRPKFFWTMPFQYVCSSWTKRKTLSCGCQQCIKKGKEFDSAWQFKQRLWSKADQLGHPDTAQLEVWEKSTTAYRTPVDKDGVPYTTNPLHDHEGKRLDLDPLKNYVEEGPEEAIQKQKKKMTGQDSPSL